MTVAASSDSNWRKTHAGDLRLAVQLATVLAEAAKDRSADYLCAAKDHPGLTGFAHAVAGASLERRLSHVREEALGLPQRAVGHWLASYVAARSESQLYQSICLSRYDAVSSAAGGARYRCPFRFPSRTPATAPRLVCQPPGPSVMM